MSLTTVDLFAGTGGFTCAFRDIAECVFANDNCPQSEKAYRENFPTVPFELKDINSLDPERVPPHKVLCAGFPCQPFSVAGERRGFSDERSHVFYRLMDIVSRHRPDVVFLENVRHLLTHDKGRTFSVVEKELTNQGYTVVHKVLDTSRITSLPHHRERIYIVAFKDEDKADVFKEELDDIEETDSKDMIADHLESTSSVPDKYYYHEGLKVYPTVKQAVVKHVRDDVVYQYRRYYVRENKSGCCPTLTANMGTGGHNVPLIHDDRGIRKLTPRECFNLQGFPANYHLPSIGDSSLYKLAGNAVSVPVVRHLAKAIEKSINS